MHKYFKLIRKDVDVAPLLAEIEQRPEAWLLNTSRQDKIKVQKDTNTIFLRKAVPRPDLNTNENQECVTTAAAESFPLAMRFLEQAAIDLRSPLSRATIVRLKPHSEVGVHIDIGSYYLIRNRYHLVLRSPSGSVLRAGDEEVRMSEGELWWFDNKQHHSAFNESDEWRIHYIFDVLQPGYASLAVNPLPRDQLPAGFV